jgi:hypothetical protein
MAATLALIAALFFAAATLEQKGTQNLPTISLAQPMSIVRLAGDRTWLIGLGLTFVGAVVICRAREAAEPDPALEPGVGLPAAPNPARDT